MGACVCVSHLVNVYSLEYALGDVHASGGLEAIVGIEAVSLLLEEGE